MPGRPWLATAQSGTGTVRTPQPGRPYPQKITIRPVNLARPHRRPVRRTVAAAAEVRLWRSSDCRSRRRISTTFAGVRGIPATVVGPEVDTRSVLRVRTVVVFPVPFGSMKPKTSSRPISKERSSNAARSPKRLPSPWAGNACPDYEQTAPGRRSARRMPPPSPGVTRHSQRRLLVPEDRAGLDPGGAPQRSARLWIMVRAGSSRPLAETCEG